MEPIKVDFTKNKEKEVVIEPEKAGLKIVINLIITAVIAAIAYYVMLPALNFKSEDFYYYIGIVLAGYVAASALTTNLLFRPEYTSYVKKQATVPAIGIGVLIVIFLIGMVSSSVVFRAKSYKDIIAVQDGDFAKEVDTIEFKSVPRIDREAAVSIADKQIGELSDLVSQFLVNTSEFGKDAQINYKNTPVQVVPLEYANIIKWFTNRSEGLPAYVVVDMVTQNAEVHRVEGGIKYSTCEHFGRLLKRHLRFGYPTALFADPTFEIDENGNPYWICPKLDKTIGLFGGTDVVGAVLVDAVTGEMSYHTIDDIRTKPELQWIDRVYSANLLVEQFNYYALYQHGFFNSILGQKDVRKTTEGNNFLALNDDVYMYTGVTSIVSDESIVGFTLINQRTKEAKFYLVAGAKEMSAQRSAQDMVQDLGYRASFPLLLNISGQPTYFMPLKGESTLVKSYAMVNVQRFEIAVFGSTVEECMTKYVEELEKKGIDVDVEITDEPTADKPNAPTTKEVSGVIADIRSAVKGGNTYYYIKLDGDNVYYSIAASADETAVILNKGDKVTFTIPAETEGAIVSASKLKLGA